VSHHPHAQLAEPKPKEPYQYLPHLPKTMMATWSRFQEGDVAVAWVAPANVPQQ